MLDLQEKEPAAPMSPFAAQSAADAHPLESAAGNKGILKPPLAGPIGQPALPSCKGHSQVPEAGLERLGGRKPVAL